MQIVNAKCNPYCKIGAWSKSAGPTVVTQEELLTFFHNNKTLKSLIITDCNFFYDNRPWTPTATLMASLKYLNIHCWDRDFAKIMNCLCVPQFRTSTLSKYPSLTPGTFKW